MNECKLVDVEKFQKVPTSECKVLGQVPYIDIISHNESVKGYKMKCDVNQKTICQTKTENKCKTIYYNEFKEKSKRVCEKKYTYSPKQTIEHKKKCLKTKTTIHKPSLYYEQETEYSRPYHRPSTNYKPTEGN